jgi:DNA invertase Pin-like site-specific DNA recombinase
MASLRAPTTRPQLAWGYVRYSTAKQGENSAERQCVALERWAERTGAELAYVAYDPAVSRTTDQRERPGLVQALDSVHAAGVGVLVAENVSRLGDSAILEPLRRELYKRKARLATADETGNADLDEDRQDFDALLSKREIKQIRQRTKGALAVKRLRGERVGGIPWGSKLATDGSHSLSKLGERRCEADCAGCLHLEPDRGERDVIARAKALSDEGLSIRRIAAQLEAEGVVGRTRRPLSSTQVHRFLRPLLLAELGGARA